MCAGLEAAPSAQPAKGPLSYLSTVTTPGSSEWGSRSLDALSQQPSDAASMRSSGPLAHQPSATASTGGPAAAATGSAASTMRQQSSSGRQAVPDDIRQSSSAAGKESQPQTGQIGRTSSSQQRAAHARAQGQTNAAGSDLKPEHSQQPAAAAPATDVPIWQQQWPESDAVEQPVRNHGTGWSAEEADWGALGSNAAAPASAMPTRSTASLEASSQVPPSSQELPATAADDWSGFGSQANPFESTDSAFHGSASQSAQAPNPTEVHNTNPFLQPGEDPWQSDKQVGQAEAPDVTRMASGESFGDFNAPGEDEFGATEWGAASASAADNPDWAVAPSMPADPFAASASFKDFAALLDPVQTDFLGGMESMQSADAASVQMPTAGHVDLSELQDSQESSSGHAASGWPASSFDQPDSLAPGVLFDGLVACHGLESSFHMSNLACYAATKKITFELNVLPPASLQAFCQQCCLWNCTLLCRVCSIILLLHSSRACALCCRFFRWRTASPSC